MLACLGVGGNAQALQAGGIEGTLVLLLALWLPVCMIMVKSLPLSALGPPAIKH